MAAEVKKEIQLEIAHVLFTDIVGYSKVPILSMRLLRHPAVAYLFLVSTRVPSVS
jgi:hypothetical protein